MWKVLQTKVYVPSRECMELQFLKEMHNTQNEIQTYGKHIKTLTEKMNKAYE